MCKTVEIQFKRISWKNIAIFSYTVNTSYNKHYSTFKISWLQEESVVSEEGNWPMRKTLKVGT